MRAPITLLPKDKHLGTLPQGKVEESPYGWISQLKACQFLSAGPQVIYPVGLNGDDQLVTINLPEPLHSGSSITTNEHSYLRIDIPLATPEESECTTLPLGRAHTTLAATTSKTPWKPRITLMEEVNDLLDRGMEDDYSHESEHSAMGKETATEADMPPPQKVEIPAPPLDTSSQASADEAETSPESNPPYSYPIAAADSSRSDSPTVDLMGLQEDANLAVNYMLSVKRSLDLKRQWAIQNFHTLLCQEEAEEATANEKAKIIHSKKNLNAKVECAKAVMEAKYNYRMAMQEARMIRSNQLLQSETEYLQARSENAAVRSTWSTKLHREHVEHMHKLEEQALREENKSCQDFLSVCQVVLRHALQPLWENLSTSYYVMLGHLPSLLQYVLFARTPQAEEQPSATTSPKPEPKQSPWPKRQYPLPGPWGSMSMDETSSKASQEGLSSSKRRETPNWSISLKPSHADAFSHDSNPIKEARSCYFATHPHDWIHGNTDDLSDIFRELAAGAGLLDQRS